MARRIVSVRGKSDVVADADIFIGGYGSGFGFGAGIGEQPARKSAGRSGGDRQRVGSAETERAARSEKFS